MLTWEKIPGSPRFFHTASDGKPGGAWERDVIAKPHYATPPILQLPNLLYCTWKWSCYKPDETDLIYQMVQDLLHSQIVSGSIKHSPSEAEPGRIRDVHFCNGQLVSKRQKSSNFTLKILVKLDKCHMQSPLNHLTTNYTWSFTEQLLVGTLHKWTLHLHIPQRAAWVLGMQLICWMLPPSNQMARPLSPPSIPLLCYLRSKIWLLSNIQQSLMHVQLAACNLKLISTKF